MKKKIALLLAAVMTLSLLPMNLFASSKNTLINQPATIPEKAVLIEYMAGFLPVNNHYGYNLLSQEITEKNSIKYAVTASQLKITLEDDVATGATIDLELTNAIWFFRSLSATPEGGLVANKDFKDLGKELATYPLGAAENVDKTYDASLGFYVPNAEDSLGGLYTRYYAAAWDTDEAARYGSVPYTLRVNEADNTRAVLTVTGTRGYVKGDVIIVPIVSKVASSGDVSILVKPNVQTISAGRILISTTAAGATSSYVKTKVTHRTDFAIDKFIINETRIASLKPYGGKQLTLTVPNGFEFARSSGITTFVDGGFANVFSDYPDRDISDLVSFKFNDIDGEEDRTKLIVTFNGDPIRLTSTVLGTLYFEGLKVVADDDAPFGVDVTIRIAETSTKGAGVTNETVVAGYRKNWSYTFKLNNDVRELISGRYIPSDSSQLTDSLTDDYHYLGEVTFGELVPGTWHAERESVFSLNPGVKFRKVEISGETQIESGEIKSGTSYWSTKTSDVGVAPEKGAKTYTYYAQDGRYYETATESFGDAYPTDGLRHHGIMVSTTSKDGVEYGYIQMNNLHIKDNDKMASIKMKLWVSIQANYEGDITLTAEGSALRNYSYDAEEKAQVITIGKAVPPVRVTVEKVEDVKVGYQFQTTSNIKIEETRVGALLRGKDIKVSLTDLTSNDNIIFTEGWTYTINNGDIKLEALSGTASGTARDTSLSNEGTGTIRFNVKTTSSKISDFTIKNVQIRTGRDVPQSNFSTGNRIGYDVVVWGTAIAENYGNKVYNTKSLVTDMFKIPGISKEYLKVVTSATDKSSILTQPVYVTVGDPIIKVGTNLAPMDMGTAAFIQVESNSLLVPLRFVVLALGLPENAVQWNPANATATIFNGGRVMQFTNGSNAMIVNGVSTVMDNGVSAMIKDERMFIPFRALGQALGVDVDWDAPTNTAIYNKSLTLQ